MLSVSRNAQETKTIYTKTRRNVVRFERRKVDKSKPTWKL